VKLKTSGIVEHSTPSLALPLLGGGNLLFYFSKIISIFSL